MAQQHKVAYYLQIQSCKEGGKRMKVGRKALGITGTQTKEHCPKHLLSFL